MPTSDGKPEVFGTIGGKERFSVVRTNSIWGSPPADVVNLPHDDNPDSNSEISDVVTSKKSVNLECHYDLYQYPHRKEHGAGIAFGLIGTSTSPETGNGAVSSLGIICGPWSTASWYENWGFLQSVSLDATRIPGTADPSEKYWKNEKNPSDAGVRLGFFHPYLAQELPRMYEERLEAAKVYQRPISMKFCPQGYFMKGLEVRLNATILVGVSSLICEKSGSTVVVPLFAGAEHDEFTIDNAPFSLDQRIGQPLGSPADSASLVCEENEAIFGMQVRRTGDYVTGIWLGCGEAPPL